MTDLLLWSDPRPAPAWAHGGKAEALHELAAAGFDVPRFVALSDRLFRQHVDPVADGLAAVLAAIVDGGEEEASAELRGLVEGIDIDAALRDALVTTWHDQLGGSPVAVRSSAVGEDGAEQSFAGQHDSLLQVRDEASLIRAVVRCWSSAFTARALAYRRLGGAELTLDPFRMGVVVQEMVLGEVSGVMFTVHPVSGDRDRVLINAVYGLGEGLVSGELDADSFDVHRLTGEVERELADKTTQVQAAAAGGIETVAVAGDHAGAATLTEDQARALATLGIRLQAQRGAPQDVEWTLSDGAVVLLQSRPITALPPPPRRDDPPHRRIWNNSNIVESYTGVTSPLTFSFARGNYEIVYRQFHQLVGVPADVMAANEDLYPNFLGLIRGRIYYNLMNIYRLVALLPGFQFNKPLLEQMMGLKEVAEYAPPQPSTSATRKYLVEFPRLVRTAAQFLYNIVTVEKRVPGFFRLFDEVVEDHAAQDYRSLDPAEIAERYADLKRRLLWQWKVPIVNDFAVMIFYGALRGVTGKWGIDDTDALHHELLCGEGGLMSTEPAKAALRLATAIRGEPDLDRLFAEGDGDSLLAAYQTRTPSSPLWDGLDDYLDAYGYRCVGELKLEETSLKDDPRMLLVSLQGYLAGEVPDPDALDAAEGDKRREAERKVAQALRLRPVKRLIYGWLLGKARAAVRDRENLRFCRTRIFGLTRDLFRGLGWQLYRSGHLADPTDVFYLEVGELLSFVEGTATCTDLRGLAAVRRAEFDGFEGEPDPDDNIVTGGIPYHNNPLWGGTEPFEPAEDGALAGTPCAPGRVKAPVRVVLSPRGEPRLNGEILVAARTDPGWVTLFPTAAGLLIERGSPLSHSAVVARELGIPAIVGIRGLIETLSSGDVVEMDGGTGRVAVE
jgi:rifampicin phosphotransferase